MFRIPRLVTASVNSKLKHRPKFGLNFSLTTISLAFNGLEVSKFEEFKKSSQFLVLALRLCYYEALCIWRRSCLRIGKWRWSDSHLRLHWTKSGHRLISNRISFHSCWISITRHTIVYKLAASNLLCFLFYLRTTIDISMCHHMNLPVSIPILWTFIWCCHKECW